MATKKELTLEEQRETLLADLLENKKVFEDSQAKYQEFVSENPNSGTKQASLAEIRALMAKRVKLKQNRKLNKEIPWH